MNNKKFNLSIIFLCCFFLIMFIAIFLTSNKVTYSITETSNTCSKDAVLQMAKIVAKEVGIDVTINPEDNFYNRITTASIVLNNANNKSGSTWYEKIYNLTDNNYQSYSSYKDKDFEDVVEINQGELLYISQLVLTGKYNLPSSMVLQAAGYIVEQYGVVWDTIPVYDGFYDAYFGYERELNNVDVFGKTISDTSNTYYRNLAKSLKLSDYSNFTVDNICQISLDGSENTSYTVKFYMNDGSENLYKTITVNSNESIILPNSPNREGYDFVNWTYKNGDIFENNTKINNDLELYASWNYINNSIQDTDQSEEPDIFDNTQNDIYNDNDSDNDEDNLSPEEIPSTGDTHMYIIILCFIMLLVSIYLYNYKFNNN